MRHTFIGILLVRLHLCAKLRDYIWLPIMYWFLINFRHNMLRPPSPPPPPKKKLKMYILSHCGSYMKTLLYICLQYDEVINCGHLGTPGRKDPHRTTDSFFKKYLGVLADVRQIQEYQNLRKRRPHLGGDICTTRKNNWQPIFHRLSQCKKSICFAITFFPCSPGPGSSCNGHNKPILLPRYPLTHINVPVK